LRLVHGQPSVDSKVRDGTLTAAALVKLVEQGKLDLDAPIQRYIPSFSDKGATITPRMLAGHLGGIRHYKDNEFLNLKALRQCRRRPGHFPG
jgi:CubicO group peptidase (beta-lactamase class C family)